MEFHIRLPGPIDPGAIEQALHAVDPAAIVDIDPATRALRVAAAVSAEHLLELLHAAGYRLHLVQITQTPSICCGGCSG